MSRGIVHSGALALVLLAVPPVFAQSKPAATSGKPGEAPVTKPRDGVPILGPGQKTPAKGPASRPAGSRPTSPPAASPPAASPPAASPPAAGPPAASQPTSQPAASGAAASRPAGARPTSQPTEPNKKLPVWAPKLRATIKPAAAYVGDPITVTITTRYKKGVSVTLPLKLELGEFAELSRKESRQESGRQGHIPNVEHTFTLEVGAYKLGELELPPIEINALGPGGELVTLKTPALPIQIKTVMPNEPKPKLKEVEKPVRVYQRTYWLLYLLLVVGVIGITAIITLIVRRRIEQRRRAERPPPPPPPPHDVALRRLAGLDVEQYIADERFKDLYLELSEIVREYIGGRFGFDALEMTTTEINETLEKRHVSLALRQQLQTYFNDCDLVKFARFRPEDDDARSAAQEAGQLVRDTTAAWGLPPTPGAAQQDVAAVGEAPRATGDHATGDEVTGDGATGDEVTGDGATGDEVTHHEVMNGKNTDANTSDAVTKPPAAAEDSERRS